MRELQRTIVSHVVSVMRWPRWAIAVTLGALVLTGAIVYREKMWPSLRDMVRHIIPVRQPVPFNREESPKPEHAQQQPKTPQPFPSPTALNPKPLQAIQEVELVDGSVTLTTNGQLNGLETYSVQINQVVKRAVDRGGSGISIEIVKPSLQGAPTMGGPDKQFIKIEYPNGVVVATGTPTLRWTPFASTSRYTIKLYDDANKFAGPVLTAEVLSGTRWTALQSLEAGRVYVWQVSTVNNDQRPVVGEGRFKVIDASDAQLIAEAEEKAPRSHLVIGVLYAKAGVLDKAEHEFQLLLNENHNSKVARNLLMKVRASRK